MGVNQTHSLTLLGPFRWTTADGVRLAIPSRKGMALIALLALDRNGERSRALLQDRLWGSRDPAQAGVSLRRELSNLRLLLNRPDEQPLLETDAHSVRLGLARIRVDARELASATPPPWITTAGEFLEGLDIPGEDGFEDWLRIQRREYGELVEATRQAAWRNLALNSARSEPPLDALQLAAGRDPPLPLKPSVAVLPLRSIGGDSIIAQGLSEQISLALACWPTLFVVAAGTLGPDAGMYNWICRQLGVRYLIDGVVRQSDGLARISVRLHDGALGRQLWAQQFDVPVDHVFEVQDVVADTVAPLIDSALEKNERAFSAASRGPVGVHLLYWKANQIVRDWRPESFREAISILDQALELDPENSWAAALAALCHAVCLGRGWGGDPPQLHQLVATALRTGSEDAYVLGHIAGVMLGAGHDPAAAEQLVQRALAMNPRMPATLFWGGWVSLGLGRPDDALQRFTLALRVNPKMAMRSYVVTGLALSTLATGQRDTAYALAQEAVLSLPSFAPAVLVAAACQPTPVEPAMAKIWLKRLCDAGGLVSAFAIIRDPRTQAMLRSAVADLQQAHVGGSADVNLPGAAVDVSGFPGNDLS